MGEFDFYFEWNGEKAAINEAKHGVSFQAATTVLRDALALTIFDGDHSTPFETRWVTIGRTADGVLVAVVHLWQDLEPNSARVRIISARPATKKEQRTYERDYD